MIEKGWRPILLFWKKLFSILFLYTTSVSSIFLIIYTWNNRRRRWSEIHLRSLEIHQSRSDSNHQMRYSLFLSSPNSPVYPPLLLPLSLYIYIKLWPMLSNFDHIQPIRKWSAVSQIPASKTIYVSSPPLCRNLPTSSSSDRLFTLSSISINVLPPFKKNIYILLSINHQTWLVRLSLESWGPLLIWRRSVQDKSKIQGQPTLKSLLLWFRHESSFKLF